MNTQEKSPEISNGHTTALFWEYDSRVARRWNLDPRPVTSISPYNTFQGNPIANSDPKGDTIIVPTDTRGHSEIEIESRISHLIEDSEAFETMYNFLENSSEDYTIRVLYGREAKKYLGNANAVYDRNIRTITLRASWGKSTFVEEFAHAFQHANRDKFESNAMDMLTLVRANKEDLDIQERFKTISQYTSSIPSGNSFIEVEAKLIRRFVYTQARVSSPTRNTWLPPEGSEGGVAIQNYLDSHHLEGMTRILTAEQVQDFHLLQINFQNYYEDSGAGSGYTTGAREIKPLSYNSLFDNN